MRLPRDLSGRDLAKALSRLGYTISRQTGSHIRLTTHRKGEHHVTIPDHASMRVGTLGAVIGDVARHHGVTRDEVARMLFGGRT
jgi:predicted RNA binding protein YcfA (HicA-like mRNA interferase family)